MNSLPFIRFLLYNNYDIKNEVTTLANKSAKKKTEAVTNHPNQNHYHNPTETWWGKLVVWLLLMGMVGLIILGLVLAIISGSA